MADKKKSIAVLLSLMTRLKDSDKKDSIYEEITGLLVRDGVCTEEEIHERERMFEQMVSEIEQKLFSGISYKEAYRKVSKKYPEFNKINLN